jgi:hypothetical protein
MPSGGAITPYFSGLQNECLCITQASQLYHMSIIAVSPKYSKDDEHLETPYEAPREQPKYTQHLVNLYKVEVLDSNAFPKLICRLTQ